MNARRPAVLGLAAAIPAEAHHLRRGSAPVRKGHQVDLLGRPSETCRSPGTYGTAKTKRTRVAVGRTVDRVSAQGRSKPVVLTSGTVR